MRVSAVLRVLSLDACVQNKLLPSPERSKSVVLDLMKAVTPFPLKEQTGFLMPLSRSYGKSVIKGLKK